MVSALDGSFNVLDSPDERLLPPLDFFLCRMDELCLFSAAFAGASFLLFRIALKLVQLFLLWASRLMSRFHEGANTYAF